MRSLVTRPQRWATLTVSQVNAQEAVEATDFLGQTANSGVTRLGAM